jgi:hypothetical protein
VTVSGEADTIWPSTGDYTYSFEYDEIYKFYELKIGYSRFSFDISSEELMLDNRPVDGPLLRLVRIDDSNLKYVNATVLGTSLCGDIFLIRFDDDVMCLPFTIEVAGNTYFALNLPEEYKIEGARISVKFRLPKDNEAVACPAFAFLYPAVYIVSVKDMQEENSEESNFLIGTKWKLAGIGSLDKIALQELEPKDCDKCYTLTFDTDSTFSTFSSTNTLQGIYRANYGTQTIQISDFGGTKINEFGDGVLYVNPFWEKSIQSFSLQGNELRLYYNENKNYLLFKSLE